jgi:hypothetical protein
VRSSVFNGRERFVAELIDVLRRRQVLEPVLAEVAQFVGADEVARRPRDERLPAMTDSGDSGRAVDVDANVALLGEQRLSGVDAYADTDWSVVQCVLCATCGRESVSRAGERDEEGIALRVDLDATVRREHLAQQTPVLPEKVGVRVAEFAQQSSRALDIREKERDGPARQLAHGFIMLRMCVDVTGASGYVA